MSEKLREEVSHGTDLKDGYATDQVDTTDSAGQTTVLSTEPLDWPLWTKVH